MFEGLVKQLRYCATHDCHHEGEELVGCTAPYSDEYEGITTCNDVLQMKAADAIEELNLIAESNRRSMETWAAEAAIAHDMMPHWIPVTERLPEEKYAVLVWEPKYLNPYVCVLSEGEWYVFGGYGVKDFGVTHWMPIPDPPTSDGDKED